MRSPENVRPENVSPENVSPEKVSPKKAETRKKNWGFLTYILERIRVLQLKKKIFTKLLNLIESFVRGLVYL